MLAALYGIRLLNNRILPTGRKVATAGKKVHFLPAISTTFLTAPLLFLSLRYFFTRWTRIDNYLPLLQAWDVVPLA